MRKPRGMQPILTVLINFHHEGHLAHPALRSARIAAEHAHRRGVGCRLVAVIDRGDETTRTQVARFRDRLDAVFEVDFGDLARARNHGIARVDTEYLALLDGDDLFDRDWLWKGVRLLEQCGRGDVVAHAAVRLNFGAERYGRIQIATDGPRFHPLNLIASWHYAADLIAPTDLFRRLPFAAFDHDHNLGSEDWLWTCESIAEGVRHVVVPETVYFYRRQRDWLSLGFLRGYTFRPTRLLERETVAALDAAYPSAAIRFADRATSREAAQERWSALPPWLEASLERACELDLALHDLYRERAATPLETPHFYPAVGHFYLKLMSQLGGGRVRIVFLCDRLAPWNLEVIEEFLAAQRQRPVPALEVLIVALAPPGAGAVASAVAACEPDTPWLRLRHVDLGAEAAFERLWVWLRHSLLVRFLLQARPALVVNLDSAFVDGLVAAFGPAVASDGTRTVRVCHARRVEDGVDGPLADWRSLIHAEARYSFALCRNRAVSDHLNAYFGGSDVVAIAADGGSAPGDGRSIGATVHHWLAEGPPGSPDAAGEPDGGPGFATMRTAGEPDISIVVPVGSEGYYLNPALSALAAMAQDATEQGFCAELVVVAGRLGPRTRRILTSLQRRWPGARVIDTGLDDEGAALNAGVTAARGRYVAVAPATEPVSTGWLARAVDRCRDAGPDAIVHPEAMVEYGAAIQVGYQPDMEDPSCCLADLAFHETWTAHALAARELFGRVPYRSVPVGSGYGHVVWHWNCETVGQGCRHLTVPETAVYRRAAGSVGESQQTLGPIERVTLPPSSFFTSHAWLQATSWARVDAGRGFPADWDESAYLSAYPDVERAVERGLLPSGYAHYRFHGWHEGRAPARSGGRRADAGRRPRPTASPPCPPPAPAGWDEAAYLRASPDVARAVAGAEFPSGYAHYCLHGRQAGRAATWVDAAAPGERREPLPRFPLRPPPPVPAWLRWALSACPTAVRRRLSAALRPLPTDPLPLPRWLDEDMRRLAAAEPGMKPHAVGAPVSAPVRGLWAARAYRTCWRAVAAAQPTHIVLAPALRPGGAELSMQLCIGEILRAPDNRVLVITTDSPDARWRDRLPARCEWLPFPAPAERHDDERAEVLARLLVNAGARVLHSFYSELGWRVLRRHAAALAAQMKIFVSIFFVPPAAAGVGPGYAQYLGRLLPHLAGILSDNQRAATTLHELFGVPCGQIAVVPHPVAARARFAGPGANGNLVLWAGRLDADKRPDLLRAIAERLPAVRFHVYGTPVLDSDAELTRLRAVTNIDYRGPFDGFDTIAAAPYHCLLYTSRWDGLPNVLLEAMQAGLLVLASDVGGIREVVDGDTGVLVRPPDDPAAYVAAIEMTLRDRETWRRAAAKGQRRVATTFTVAAFREALRSVPGYLS